MTGKYLELNDEEACLLLQILSQEFDSDECLLETIQRLSEIEPDRFNAEEEALIYELSKIRVLAEKVHSFIGGIEIGSIT